MNKQEAADFLGVSTRAVERYVSKGKLSATYIRGETGQRAVFEEKEVRRLKEELERPAYPLRPAVAVKPVDKPDRRDSPDKPDRADARRSGLPVAVSQAAEAAARSYAVLDRLAVIQDRQVAVLEALKPPAQPAVPVADKLTLNLSGAAALSGLSRSYLVAAIHEGKLKAAKRGRGWNIKRVDLNAYVEKL